jgi:hypothetical protein
MGLSGVTVKRPGQEIEGCQDQAAGAGLSSAARCVRRDGFPDQRNR